MSTRTSEPKHQDAHAAQRLQQLIALWQSAQWQACYEAAQRMVIDFPEQGMAWKLLGVLHDRFAQPQLALQAWLTAQTLLPEDAEVALNLGNLYARQPDYPAATRAYQHAIHCAPTYAQAYENLGSVLHLQGALTPAVQAFTSAIEYAPQSVLAHAELGLLLHKLGQPREAMRYYRKVLGWQPEDAVSHYNLAQALEDVAEDAEAQQHYAQALQIQPDYVDAWFNLGYLHKRHKRYDEALRCLRRVLEIEPGHERALQVLTDSYLEKGDIDQFVDTFLKTVGEGQALDTDKMNNMVAMLLQKGLPNEAEQYCQLALQHDPQHPMILNNMGLICYSRNDPYAAIDFFEQPIAANPDFFQAYSNGALPLMKVGKVSQALDYLQQSIALSPTYFAAYMNLGVAYSEQGQMDLAQATLQKAMALEPNNTQPIQSALFLSGYHGQHTPEAEAALLQRFGQLTAAAATPYSHWRAEAQPPRLKIGFVSADLKHHPVGLFLKPLLLHLNQAEFDVFIYSNSVVEDHVTGELKALVSRWQVISHLSDEMAAKRIHEDGVHLLIDLSGHTQNNRLPMFAYRPAPLQMTWLGYWASTGVTAMDYIIADPVSVPTAAQAQFSEQVAYLPETRLCFSPPAFDVAVSSLPALHNGYMTLGCYHKYTKATDAVIALWCRVLQAVPTARLRWQTTAFGDASVIAAAQARFAAHGIAAERCQFLPASGIEAYLQSHAEVDFILDTFPFTGGTTTCDALWMGVPTLTIAGDTLIARQGASLMTAAGLADWVVEDAEAFVHKAVAFADAPAALASLRSTLRPRVQQSALFDGARFTRDFEHLLRQRWQQHLAQHAPTLEAAPPTTTTAPLWVVSATRLTADAFWQKSALGQSLVRHMRKDAGITAHIHFENTQGLPEIFNAAIEQAPPGAMLLLVHDDVWLDEYALRPTLAQGLATYDVIGVAGNRHCLPTQPHWTLADMTHEVPAEDKLGMLAYGPYAFSKVHSFAQPQGEAAMLDYAAIGLRKDVVTAQGVRFDHVFDFYGYEVDFCRTARAAGLRLGVWPLAVTHQSGASIGSKAWFAKLHAYFDKWNSPLASAPVDTQAALQQAMNDVLQSALQAHAAGDLAQAARLYHEILHADAHHADALYHLALIEWQPEANAETLAQALERFKLAHTLAPSVWAFVESYVTALVQLGQQATAASVLQAAEALHGASCSALAAQLGLPAATVATTASAVAEAPDDAAQQPLLALMQAQDYAGLSQALSSLLHTYPRWLEGWKLLSDSLMIQKKDACEAAGRALALNAQDPREHCYYGLALKAQGHLIAAGQAFEQAVQLKPDYAAAWNNWGLVLKETGQSALAVSKFEQALQLQPDYVDCFSNLLFCLSHVDGVSAEQLLQVHQAFAQRYEQPLTAHWPQHLNSKVTTRTLKVGLVSADFRAHSMAHFLRPLLPALAACPQLSLVAYANQTLSDDVTREMQACFPLWRDVAGMSDEALAAQIMADGIDILIDLSGHTAGHRLLTFARKPAPVQVSWLGYQQSTGLRAIDYYLTDTLMAPPGTLDYQFSEKLVQLPVFGCFAPYPQQPDVNALPALRNGYITFGCFNRPNKITPDTVSVWAGLLNAMPDSRLLLGGAGDAESAQAVLDWLAAAGVAPARVQLAPKADLLTYLSLHHQVDICLDTMPSSGVTTTAHALWMGVPTLCMVHESVRSRGAMVLMQHAGLGHWVASDAQDFIRIGQALSHNLTSLAALRAGLRTQLAHSALSQPAALTQALVSALQTMWQRWCLDLPAETFCVEPVLQAPMAALNQPLSTGADMSLVPPPFMTDPSTFDAERSIKHLMDMALLQQQGEDFAGATQLYEKVLQQQPDHAEAHYQLGLIKTHTKDVRHGLPHFEKAVTVCPHIEQYWVGFIDAMVMAKETILARQAILEGIKHGLTAQNAAMLLDELEQATRLSNSQLIDADHSPKTTKFVIAAPAFYDKSAGIVVLHELCDAMNRRGYQTAIYFVLPDNAMISNDPHYYGPGLKWYALSGYEELQQFVDEGIVIYPEVISGNPLKAKRVVRYMLNADGAVTGLKTGAKQGDFILTFSDSYHPNPHAILPKLIHYDVFNTENTLPASERNMDMTYIGKGDKYGLDTVIPGSVELSRTWPKTREELAILLKNTRYLYTWDCRSQTVTDAILCGAIPVFMSYVPLTSVEELTPLESAYILRSTGAYENGVLKLSIPDDIQQRIKQYLKTYHEGLEYFENNVDSVLLQIVQYFGF